MVSSVFTVALALTTLSLCCHLVSAQSTENDSTEATEVRSLVGQIDECMAPVWERMSQATIGEQAHIIGNLFAYAKELVMSHVPPPGSEPQSPEARDSSHFFYFDDDMSQSWPETADVRMRPADSGSFENHVEHSPADE